MSCLKLGSLIHRKTPTSRAKPAAQKKGYHDSEPSQIGKQPPPAPAGRQPARPLPRSAGRRFDGGPTPPAPGDTPTPLPPRPPPAPVPGGIPSVGSEAPEGISYPDAPAAGEVAEEGAAPTGSWCCCCPE